VNQMHIIHESTIRNESGVIEITIFIVNKKTAKRYTYGLSSSWAAEQFHKWYRKGRVFHGKALQFLKNFQLKGEREYGENPR
jgi:hypothetical protein